MSVYTYYGNKEPGDTTAAIQVASGTIGIGEYGDLTTREFNLLSQIYDLRPGIVSPVPAPSFPTLPGHIPPFGSGSSISTGRIFGGASAPENGIGATGDFYVQKPSNLLFGPKGASWGESITIGGTAAIGFEEGKAMPGTAVLSQIPLGNEPIRWGSGEELDVYAAGGRPRVLNLRFGTNASPDTQFGPLVKTSRYVSITRAQLAEVTTGDGCQFMNAHSIQIVNAATSEVQAVGLFIGGQTYSNVGFPGNDVCPLYVVGRAMAGATGTAFAAFMAGRRDESSGRFTTLELHGFNNGTSGELFLEGASSTKLIWATCAGEGQTAVFCQIGNPWGRQFRYGFHANRQRTGELTGGISEAYIRDDSSAKVSLDIYGSHAEAAIRVAESAGRILLGGSRFTYASSKLEVSASEGSYDPLVALFVPGRSSHAFRIANGIGGQKLFVSGGRENFLRGTLEGDPGIEFNTIQIWHLGVTGQRGTLRVGANNWSWGQQPDSYGEMVGGEFLADCTTAPRRAPEHGILRYSENGFPRFMDALGSVIPPGEQNTSYHRTSDVSTINPDFAGTQVTLTSGTAYAATARVRRSGTYTKIRFATGSAGATVTDLRAGVWDSTGRILSQTADLSERFVLNRIFDNITLESPVTLREGEIVFLGIGSVASTAITVRGQFTTNEQSALARLDTGLQRVRTHGSLTTAQALSNLVSSGGAGNLVWVELIP